MNYKDSPGLTFENVAITNQSGVTVDMFSPKGGEYEKAFARFSTDQLKGALDCEKVTGITLRDLLERNAVQRVDFIQIDAEGYDDQIVAQAVNLPENLKPRLMHFENGWFGVKKIRHLYKLLDSKGYRMYHGTGPPDCDTVALLIAK